MTLAQTKNPNPCQQLQVLCAPPGKENWDLNGPEWMARAKTFIAGKERRVYVSCAEKVRGKSWHSLEKLSLSSRAGVLIHLFLADLLWPSSGRKCN